MVYSSILLTLWAGLFAAAGIAVGVLFMRRRYTYLQRKEADAQMALEKAAVLHSQQLALMNSIDDLAWLKDAESRFLFVNRKFGQVFGRDCQSLVGKTDYDLSAPEMAAHYQAHDRLVLDTQKIQRVEELITLENGSMGWSETIKVPVFDAHGEIVGTAGVARDITERKLFQQRMEHLARHDPLTGLLNRIALERHTEHLKTLSLRPPNTIIMLMDLDHFKKINDTYGHSVGDEVLRLFSSLLKAEMKKDQITCRYGGEEFLIISSYSTKEQMINYAERIRQLTQELQPKEVNGDAPKISVSIGLSMLRPNESIQSAIQRADERLYRGKRTGRNRVVAEEIEA